MIAEGLTSARRFLELIRFSHTVFALPFALFSAVLAWQQPGAVFRLRDAAGILLCMVFARSASMAFNRLADRRIDAQNPRTASRHLPAGLLSVTAATLFTAVSAIGFVVSTLLFLPNRWPLLLTLPVLAFLLAYSNAKRWTALAHFWLGAALMLSPVAAWIALTGGLAWPPVLLGLAVLFWVGGFDVIYACQDVEFDRSARLRSIPARFGLGPALKLAAFSHLLTVVFLAALWWTAGLGPLFAVGVVAVALLLAYEHSLVRPDDLTRVNMAFFNVNAVISIGLLVVGSLDVWTHTSIVRATEPDKAKRGDEVVGQREPGKTMSRKYSIEYIDRLLARAGSRDFADLASVIESSARFNEKAPDYGLPQFAFLFLETNLWIAQAMRSGVLTYFEATPQARQDAMATSLRLEAPQEFALRYEQGMREWRDPAKTDALDSWIDANEKSLEEWLWNLMRGNRDKLVELTKK